MKGAKDRTQKGRKSGGEQGKKSPGEKGETIKLFQGNTNGRKRTTNHGCTGIVQPKIAQKKKKKKKKN